MLPEIGKLAEDDDEPGKWFSLFSQLILSHSMFTPPLQPTASVKLLETIRTKILPDFLSNLEDLETVCLTASLLRLTVLSFANNADNI